MARAPAERWTTIADLQSPAMSGNEPNRRDSIKAIAAAAAGLFVHCTAGGSATVSEAGAAPGRLDARPGRPSQPGHATQGPEALGLGTSRDGVFYAAPSPVGGPTPLILLLHGAGGSGMRIFSRVREDIVDGGGVVVAADSRGETWDLVRDGLGPDVRFIDAALGRLFDRYSIDPSKLCVAGHSDGASYALTLGIANGDLFSHVIAFSPGFLAVKGPSRKKSKIFIAHGRQDEILPIEQSGRRISSLLRQSGYNTTFREFEGGHALRPEIVREAMRWWRGT
jgi:phospholipase/carboxylesterase